MQHRRTWMITALISALAALPLLASGASAQGATPTPDPASMVLAMTSAQPPDDLPGNDDADIVMHTWEEFYGEGLATAEGAWLLTGSPELPIATVIIFSSDESAQTSLGDYRNETSRTEVNGLDAWAVADRGKWICIAADGPAVVIGQALPTRTVEPPEEVEQRACDVLGATLDWLHHNVMGLPLATPDATPDA